MLLIFLFDYILKIIYSVKPYLACSIGEFDQGRGVFQIGLIADCYDRKTLSRPRGRARIFAAPYINHLVTPEMLQV